LAQATGTVLQEAASHAGNMVFQGVAQDVADRNGISLTQLNVALTAASVTGNVLVGSRLGQLRPNAASVEGSNVAGILSRDNTGIVSRNIGSRFVNRALGLPFDAVDLALNYQGLPSASGYQALFGGTAPALQVGHSAGASEVSTLTSLGIMPSGADAVSLPIGRVAPSGVRVINGRWDLVNGGWLGRLLNPGATMVNTGSMPISNHLWSEYVERYPPPRR
jgi:filamentous hemagglutinin